MAASVHDKLGMIVYPENVWVGIVCMLALDHTLYEYVTVFLTEICTCSSVTVQTVQFDL